MFPSHYTNKWQHWNTKKRPLRPLHLFPHTAQCVRIATHDTPPIPISNRSARALSEFRKEALCYP